MKLLLNNIFKGLLVSLLVITLGGFLYINISKPEEINLQLISSSVVNQLGTESKNLKENKKDNLNNENKTSVEDKKETEVKEEETSEKEDTTEEIEVTETPKEETKTEEKTEVQEEVKEEIKEEVKEETPQVEENKEDEENAEPEKVEETNPVLEAPKEETPQNNQNNQTSGTTTGPYAPNMTAVNNASVKRSWSGRMTAYGPDCVGCGGMVAHGEYVGNGRIYYNDPTFGTIRIVAGDKSVLPIGSIVRIKGLKISSEPVIAIMLDTGGAIRASNGIYFDLLYESEAVASSFSNPEATYEILREGF